MELSGQVAIVTGGAVRIGRTLSLALADAGMRICLHYGTSEQAARETVQTIIENGGEATTVAANLVDPVQAADTIVNGARAEFGQVDVLVNCASIFEAGTLADLSLENWQRHQAINLAAPTFLCQQFAAVVRQRSGALGAIVNIADWRALKPQAGHLAYTISKAGLVALTQILALELAPTIRVNAIAPGAILPPAGAGADYEQQMASVIPLRRTGAPQDIAEAALFLLRSDFITGEVLHVTGGQHLSVQMPDEG